MRLLPPGVLTLPLPHSLAPSASHPHSCRYLAPHTSTQATCPVLAFLAGLQLLQSTGATAASPTPTAQAGYASVAVVGLDALCAIHNPAPGAAASDAAAHMQTEVDLSLWWRALAMCEGLSRIGVAHTGTATAAPAPGDAATEAAIATTTATATASAGGHSASSSAGMRVSVYATLLNREQLE